MLAVKTTLAEVDEIPILIFDEVDANVGGETAGQVGKKLRALMPWMRTPERAPEPIEARGGAADFGFRMM